MLSLRHEPVPLPSLLSCQSVGLTCMIMGKLKSNACYEYGVRRRELQTWRKMHTCRLGNASSGPLRRIAPPEAGYYDIRQAGATMCVLH